MNQQNELHAPRGAEQPRHNGSQPAHLIGEIPVLPKRFFTLAQEGISMLWLTHDPKKPDRKKTSNK